MDTSVKYSFQALNKENFWLLPAFAGLFLLITALVGPDQKVTVGRSFLGYVLPLLTGGLSAYAFLADSALELQFSTKRSAARMIFERLGVVFGITVVFGILYQFGLSALGVSLSSWGGILFRQFIWLIPCFTTLTLGAMASLLARNPHGGFAFIGGLWIIQLVARGWFALDPIFRNIFLFYGAMDPTGELRLLNQIVLSTISLVSLWLTHSLLKKQERYL
ncbi:MAG: hypothetical protein H0S79_08920 [Anaerolineaceae bacterium]|nr:hypothetical protein [Anaerolineaceae bacterium]